MKNVTIALDEEILRAGRNYATEHRTSLNNLIRQLLEQAVVKKRSHAGLQEFFDLADRAKGNSGGWKWRREDLYDV